MVPLDFSGVSVLILPVAHFQNSVHLSPPVCSDYLMSTVRLLLIRTSSILLLF